VVIDNFIKRGRFWLPRLMRSEAGYLLLMHRRAGFQFICQGVTLDGTNDYMTRGADLSGNADSKEGTISFWFMLNGKDGEAQSVFWCNNNNFGIYRPADNKFDIYAGDGVDTAIGMTTATAYTADSTWHHFIASWNLAIPIVHLYIDGVDDEAGGATEADKTIDYTGEDHTFGADPGGGSGRANASFAEVWWRQEYFNITQAANLQLFRKPSGKPADLLIDGSGPGNQPLCYFSARQNDAATVFATNKGTGGDFNITGAFALSATSPSD